MLLVPMGLMEPRRIWRLSAICTAAAAAGSVLGYAIGLALWDLVGEPLVNFYGKGEQFAAFQELFAEWGVWIIILKAFTPIPFKFAAIAAGLAEMDPWTFIGASVASRGLHFLMVAGLMRWLGPRFMVVVTKYESRTAVGAAIILVAIAAVALMRG
ncbi:MAG: DedA family protein [Proteobacteria bacterium]|nr:DedA family protein [Pseudomonadota bacterium]